MARKKKRAYAHGTNFVSHSFDLRTSFAWRELPDNARRVLDRLEVEHMSHGGAENGALIVTHDQFEEAGIRRASVPLAIRQCEALGFLKTQKSGYAHSNSPRRLPNRYTLTYVVGCRASPNPTDDWRRVESAGAAASALALALEAKVTPRSTLKKGTPKAAKSDLPAAIDTNAASRSEGSRSGFDRKAYQRDYMRRRRASGKAQQAQAA